MLNDVKACFVVNQNGWEFKHKDCSILSNVCLEANDILIQCKNMSISQIEGDNADYGQYEEFLGCLCDSGLDLRITYRYYHLCDFVAVQMQITNISNSPIKLGRCTLLAQNDRVGGTNAGNGTIAVFKLSGWVVDCNTIQLDSSENCKIDAKTLSVIYNRDTGKAITTGFLTFDRIYTGVEIDYNENNCLSINAFCDFEGFMLQPNSTQSSEILYVQICDSPFDAVEQWSDHVTQHYKPIFNNNPSLGWIGGWTWRCGFTQEIYEDLVVENIEAINNKLGGFGIKNIWMSIANYKDMIPGNWLEENLERFPHGWKWLFERINEKDMNPGFWIAPFWVPDKMSDFSEPNLNRLLKKDGKPVNNNYRFGYGKSQKLPVEERVSFCALDPSNQEAIDFLKHVFQELYRLGLRYYMIDFLHVASGSTPGHYPYDEYCNKQMVKGPEVYRNGLKAIREAAGKDTYLLSSTGTTLQHIGCVDAVRVGCDFGEGRPLYPEMWFYPATYRIEDYELIKKVVWAYSASYFTDRKFYLNDAFNVLTIDKPVPENEAKMIVSLFALSSGPIMLGDDIATIDSQRLEMIKKALPQYDKGAIPVDLFDVSYPDYPKIFNLRIEKEWESWNVVGLLNLSNQSLKFDVNLKNLKICESDYNIFDFWNGQYIGELSKAIQAEVPAYNIRVLRISEVKNHPWVLSTDMHVMQGAVELDRVEWDDESGCLTVSCNRPAGESGNIYIKIPQGWKPVVYKGLHTVKTIIDSCIIITKKIIFNNDCEQVKIYFEKV